MVVPSLFLIAVSSLLGAVWVAAPLGPELLTTGRVTSTAEAALP